MRPPIETPENQPDGSGEKPELSAKEKLQIAGVMLSLTAVTWMPMLGVPIVPLPFAISVLTVAVSLMSFAWQLRKPVRRWWREGWLLKHGEYTHGTVLRVELAAAGVEMDRVTLHVAHSGSVVSRVSYLADFWEGPEVGERVELLVDREEKDPELSAVAPCLQCGIRQLERFRKEHPLPGKAPDGAA